MKTQPTIHEYIPQPISLEILADKYREWYFENYKREITPEASDCLDRNKVWERGIENAIYLIA